MLSRLDAEEIVHRQYPHGKIQSGIEYGNKHVFQIFNDDPNEGMADPFFSVDKTTGEFRDFSIITDGDTPKLLALFQAAKSKGV